ncbi:hypothetical protein [Vibrio splendidus]|uniref:hypothetical protein n=1 Tax=Vibrio splendidus TaxID=29497 RepID=UPI000D35F2FC|nr:hypothetical protein [Vibrio splendidus]PTP83177.1 hypothetical protein CWO02_22830 [Vibrio splendidus]
MSSKPITLIQPLYQVLVEEQLDDFSVLELRDRFMILSDPKIDKATARRFVYRHILRLVKKRLLNKVFVDGCQKATYQKTVLFSKTSWEITGGDKTISPNETSCESELAFPKIALQERLEQCESDFLACLHEFETYQDLSSEFPHLKESLYDVRHKTKVQSSKLVGEIRAIKMALTLS